MIRIVQAGSVASSATLSVGSNRLVFHRGLQIVWLAVFLLLGTATGAAGVGDDRAAARQGHATTDLLVRAEAGDSWAQLNLGAAYDRGMAGFEPDPRRAVFWYRRAAGAGLALAQYNLAHCLATASGTRRDDREALSWMLKAARQGLPDAQFLAGVMLADGIGTLAEPDRARVWLQRAADQGHADAASVLKRLQGGAVSR